MCLYWCTLRMCCKFQTTNLCRLTRGLPWDARCGIWKTMDLLWCPCNFELLTIFFNLRLKKLGGLIVFQSIRHRSQRRSWQLLRRRGSWTCHPYPCLFPCLCLCPCLYLCRHLFLNKIQCKMKTTFYTWSFASNLEKCKLYLRDLGGNRECFQSYSKVATIILITDTVYTFEICLLRSNFGCRNL